MTQGQTSEPVKSADRALTVLDHIGERRSVTFADLVADLGLPRSSAHGLLRTLVARGWLDLDPRTREYTLGLRVWQLGQRYLGHRDLASVAAPIMDDLAQEIGETVQLARLDGIGSVYIAISEGPRPMRLASSVGMQLHAHGTGIGKALLSQLPDDEMRRRLTGVVLPQFTERTVTEPGRLCTLIGQVRDQGFALDDEEYLPGCRCVAVPLLLSGALGHPIAALSTTAPVFRCGDDWPERPLLALRRGAALIRDRLGG
ncbi:IclR family transcriptional regulator [Ruania suaedae]|uniref:IclR family transcriptional regulator n=1 Tax=Ruania suaedae TaxID=2897774 RepID=UPI001E3C781F|nr:IclR family transcriptional regulator [Ruania suaedae]UFU03954.1 IclR family transcriptional regulator [Ruania suaedae]